MAWSKKKPKNWKDVLVKVYSEYWNETYYTTAFYIGYRTEYAERGRIKWEPEAIDYDDQTNRAYVKEGWYTIKYDGIYKDVYRVNDQVLGWAKISGNDEEED